MSVLKETTFGDRYGWRQAVGRGYVVAENYSNEVGQYERVIAEAAGQQSRQDRQESLSGL